MSAKNFARQAFHYGGGTAVLRNVRADVLRICMYHRFPVQSRLEQQVLHLNKHYQPISLTDAAECLASGRTLPRKAVVVTVDDGYRDFLTTAHPVFNVFQIPVIVYLATDLPDRGAWLWNDQVTYMFEISRLPGIEIAFDGLAPMAIQMRTHDERKQAGFRVKEMLKNRSDQERRRWLRRLPELLAVDLPEKAPPEFEPLTWDDVRQLAGKGVDFGAHTKSHPILSKVGSEQEVTEEITGSKLRIEQETSRPVLHFCYPNGKSRDFDARSEAAVRGGGFRTAVTTEPGLNSKNAQLYSLKRFAFTPNYDEVKFAEVLAGLPFA